MTKVAAEVGSTANSYQLLGRLAVGGMAEIYLARGAGVAGVERYCVLKRILRERASDAQFVQMFLDEARLAAQLQHPSIASVYDIGMLGDSFAHEARRHELALEHGLYELHPDRAAPALIRRIGFSLYAQGWLPYLDEADARPCSRARGWPASTRARHHPRPARWPARPAAGRSTW